MDGATTGPLALRAGANFRNEEMSRYKESVITLRAPKSSIEERRRAAAKADRADDDADDHVVLRGKRHDLAIKLLDPIFRLLDAAARRRKMEAAEMAAGLIGAAVTRGNLEMMMSQWQGYALSRQVVRRQPHRPQHNAPKQNRGTAEISAQAEEV